MAYQGIPTKYGERGYIGPETAFFGKYAATGGKKPGYTRVTQTPAQRQAAMYPYAGLTRQISTQQESAKQANIQRYEQAMKIYEDIISRTAPGGAFEKAGLAQIETAKTRGVGKEMQQLISGGMYGTTTAAGVGRGWEADVGAPARLRLEDIMEQRRTTAQLGKAGFIERREDVYPDYNALLQMLAR